MSSVMVDQQRKFVPYRVSTEEVRQSLEWLREEYDQDNLFVGSQRSEVKEIRFKLHDVPAIKDEEIHRKFMEARSLHVHAPHSDN